MVIEQIPRWIMVWASLSKSHAYRKKDSVACNLGYAQQIRWMKKSWHKDGVRVTHTQVVKEGGSIHRKSCYKLYSYRNLQANLVVKHESGGKFRHIIERNLQITWQTFSVGLVTSICNRGGEGGALHGNGWIKQFIPTVSRTMRD